MDYQYDVAVSFLSSDETVAHRLRDLLFPHLAVFVYTHRQREVSGTDGLITFRQTFRDAARLVVVLFRRGWGETPWTRVECEAITDRFLKEGPAFLFFIMIDPSDPPPPWLPERQIRFNLPEFGLEQAAGAIKLRVQELGGKLQRETIAERARRAEERERFDAETAFLRKDTKGVDQVQQEGLALVSAIQRLAEEAAQAAPGLGLENRAQDSAVGVRSRRASLYVQLVVRWVNTLDGAFLSVRILRGFIILPGESLRYLEEPEVMQEHRYDPDRAQTVGWGWRDDAGGLMSSSGLAEHVMQLLFEAIEGGS